MRERPVCKVLSAGLLLTGLIAAPSANAQPVLEEGLAGAVRGCEEWVLNPSSWIEGAEPFLAIVGLGDRIGLVETVAEVNLPPPELRVANHYWRINSTSDAGYVLVVSDQLPMCHITGSGSGDMQPVVESLLASGEFLSRWTKENERKIDDMVTTSYRHVAEPSFFIAFSRASKPGQRVDRVQIIATAMLDTED